MSVTNLMWSGWGFCSCQLCMKPFGFTASPAGEPVSKDFSTIYRIILFKIFIFFFKLAFRSKTAEDKNRPPCDPENRIE